MIRVIQLRPNCLQIEPTAPGASFPTATLERAKVPRSILVAMVIARMNGIGVYEKGVGVLTSEHVWELDDAVFDAPLRDDA